ncbi:hypothetical protein CORC01_09893 [Colletotrichum orchidophilum]|uniref:Uncharacterized protein n=1 Tax=Colletotrichum orchidophilum TaxID=1209926 RepID=A0A1G4B095_9PEZI|nr:uncharacterized protein CORC01_09893 [Colletotrichum orchidophilum]OHE94786.1 hypothetical protein CORC01_09893 [Colletotrichum orchidophilum]
MTLGRCRFVASLSTVQDQARPGHPMALSPRAPAWTTPGWCFPWLASDIRACLRVLRQERSLWDMIRGNWMVVTWRGCGFRWSHLVAFWGHPDVAD